MSRVLPILFNTDMVRAILDGRKTVTRRCVKNTEVLDSPYHKEHPEVPYTQIIKKLCQSPYQPGDILYVRETWTLEEFYDDEALIKFRAGGEKALEYEIEGEMYNKLLKFADDKWIPSLFMPKEAARIFLKVTDVRVERLQDINGEELLKEGIEKSLLFDGDVKNAFDKFKELWNSTTRKSDLDRYGWDANPWVWVIEFERCEKPEGV